MHEFDPGRLEIKSEHAPRAPGDIGGLIVFVPQRIQEGAGLITRISLVDKETDGQQFRFEELDPYFAVMADHLVVLDLSLQGIGARGIDKILVVVRCEKARQQQRQEKNDLDALLFKDRGMKAFPCRVFCD